MMKKIKVNKLICFSLFCCLLFLSTANVHAEEEITLEEAIAWGLDQSYSLSEYKDHLEQIERKLTKIKASLNWQADLTGNLAADNQGGSPVMVTPEQESAELEVGLQGSKVYLWGMSIGPKLSLKKKLSGEKTDPETEFSFNLTQKLYPWAPSTEKQEYYTTLHSLKKAQDNLEWQVESKKIDWLEGYFNLLHLQEQVKVAEEQYRLVKNDFNLALQREKIGEAGKQQVLAEQVKLKQAEYNLKQVKNSFIEEEAKWYLELGLPAGKKVQLQEENIYFQQIKEELETFVTDWNDADQLMMMVTQNHYQLAANQLDQEELRQKWEWKRVERKPEVTTGGTYNYPDQQWKLNLNVNYKFLDGGAKKLEDQDYQAQLSSLEREHENLIGSLEIQLKKLLSQVELADLQVEEKDIQYQKAFLEKEVYRKQLEEGLITEKDWEEKSLAYKTAEINIKNARNKVFLSRLRVLHFIGMI
jgi:hypothetical protein